MSEDDTVHTESCSLSQSSATERDCSVPVESSGASRSVFDLTDLMYVTIDIKLERIRDQMSCL